MKFLCCVCFLFFSSFSFAGELKVGDNAPIFSLKTHDNKDFKLSDRKGKWTVLYFYPKAETPGCTKQACAFRDSIKLIQDLNADVFGVSSDSVEDIAKFRKKENLNFTLLSDSEGEVIEKFGAKMTLMKMAKRWTYIIDSDLKVRHIEKNVDPVADVINTAKKIKELQK
jgi:peroxiredoxin Q/BCP